MKVCEHIKGKKFSISDCTDTFTTYKEYAELLGFQYGIKLTVFDYLNSTDREDAYNSGVIDFGIYTYNAQAQLKANNSTLIDTYINDVTINRGGKKPLAFSYALGDMGYFDKAVLKTRFLMGRNSINGNNKRSRLAYNGQSYYDLICRDNSMRWNYYTPLSGNPYISGNQTDGIAEINANISETIALNGWFTNFMHWHWNIGENMETYFSALATAISTENYNSASYNDVAEYYYVRNAVDGLVRISESTIQILYSKKETDSPYDLINTPLYLSVNLKGTSFEGQFIKTSENHKIQSLGSDKYVIAVPLDFSLNQKTITILTDASENYVNETLPNIEIVGSDLTSDQPVKISIFRKGKAQNKNQVIVLERQNTLEISKTLPTFDTATYDYFIGFINENGNSGILEIN